MITAMTDVAEKPSVTFMFTDIEGSTQLLQRLGTEAYSRHLNEHRSLVRDVLQRNGGVEIDTQGDAFFVAFVHPAEAVQAAAEIARLSAHSPMRVRMGLHTGGAQRDGHGYVGEDVHLGARIAAAGH